MFDFNKAEVPINVSKDWILSKISDNEIFFHFYGQFNLNKRVKSPFRKDRNPSATFFIGKDGEIVFYDFAEGISLNCFAFVQKLYNCNFRKALEIIANDFGLIKKETLKVNPKIFQEAAQIDKTIKKETLIQFEVGEWTRKNLEFWRFGEITQEELSYNNVYPVKRLYINHNEIYNRGYDRYAYPESYEDKEGVKIYSPEDKEQKWLSSIPLDVVFGLKELPFLDNKIIIQKSKKDKIITQKFFTDVIATQNESESSLSEEIQTFIKKNYEHAFIFWDNDPVGVDNCKKFNNKGFNYINIPQEEYIKYGIKDAYDYVKAYGLEALEILFRGKGLLN